ncbi:CPBP family intramembrane glutamic endopeptidase [Sporolactobacillus vineae]|uniref:CPBP family intramembrane glutamic endopeptidase n=1 Tax=Sporolactobacillus vineae TaxID=444463 RepID=UPI00028903AC|nr:type II CAAX endopeptidase family protein [Sporolactobacillus vineae]
MTDARRRQRRAFKKHIRGLGLALIFQMAVMVAVVFIAMIVSAVGLLITHPGLSEHAFETQITDLSEQSGIPMILAVLLGFLPVLIYRRKRFFTEDLKATGEKITLKVVLIGFACVLGVNMLLTPLYVPAEWLLNRIGLTAAPSEDVLGSAQTLSMFLYVGFIAPLFEEFLYRGVVLHSLLKFGKPFAIIGSALLFGLMHGNIVQIPLGIGIGLVLGYLAMKYSVWLTIILHMANNLTTELLSRMPDNLLSVLLYAAMFAALITAVAVIWIRQRAQLAVTWHELRAVLPGKRLWLYFFTSIPMMILLLGDLIQAALGISRM